MSKYGDDNRGRLKENLYYDLLSYLAKLHMPEILEVFSDAVEQYEWLMRGCNGNQKE